MTPPELVSMHTNGQAERICIERVRSGPFTGQLLLTIVDDPPGNARAPMLLDEGTRRWLRERLDEAD